MGLLDRFRKKQTAINTSIFSVLFGKEAPNMKGPEFLGAYKGWVYSCVNAISEEVATIDLQLQRLTSDGWVEIPEHLALSTLADVNPFMSSSDLLIATQSFLELEGNAFWYLPRGSVTRKPAEIWLLDPTRTYVVKSATEFIGGYVYKNEKGEDVPFKREEIIHFKRFNPQNKYRGMGTVQAAALAIDIDTYAATWNRNFFFNSAMPSATLETAGTLTTEQYNRVKAEWDSRYKGVDNAHKLAILQGGLHFNPISLSQKDMEFLEQRKMSRDEILGIFRVPKTILGITDDVNRANAEATEYVFSKRVIKTRMEFIVDRLNEFYIEMFGEDQKKLRFTYTDPVPKNREQVLQANETGIRAGYLTINEVREQEGKQPVSGGDEIYLPLNLTPIGSVQEDSQNSQKKVQKVISLVKSTDADRVEKRVRFIQSEIKNRQGDYRETLLLIKNFLVRRVKQGKKTIKKDPTEDILRTVFDSFEDTFVPLTGKLNKNALEAAFLFGGKQALSQLETDVSFDLQNPRADEWLKINALDHAKSIVSTLKDEAKTRILDGLKEGLGSEDIASNLSDFFDSQSSWRALRIARTEVIGGYAEGSIEGYRQSGVVSMKRWITAEDDKVDDSCSQNEADGPISLGASFSSGDDAPPLHPNCRCVIAPEI